MDPCVSGECLVWQDATPWIHGVSEPLVMCGVLCENCPKGGPAVLVPSATWSLAHLPFSLLLERNSKWVRRVLSL